MTDNANYHVFAYIAFMEGRAAAHHRPWWQHTPVNPYNPRSQMAKAWSAGFSGL
jgi:hypothetical protein